jgi:hypothetical protein
VPYGTVYGSPHGSQYGTVYGTFLEAFANTMFNQSNPRIVQIRRELRGQLPDEWLEEVVSILEYQLSYQTVDELATNDLLKLRLGAKCSTTLNATLTQSTNPTSPAAEPLETKPFPLRLPWQ